MSEPRETAVLLLSCPDAKGLVAAVSDFLYRAGGNIVHADQHTDREEGVFLQRVEWELDGFAIPKEEIGAAFRPIAERFAMRWELRFSSDTPRVALLASAHPHCLQDLLARWQQGELRAEIPLVLSNHRDTAAVVAPFGVEFRHVEVTREREDEANAEILAALETARIDLVVLARYMRVLRGAILERFANRIINIHHSFLPAFAGGRPYHQAHERGVKIIGATAHYVTADLDQGPIIEQDVTRVSHRDAVADLIRKGRDLEKVVLARAVSLHLRHRVLVYGNKTVVFD